MQIHMAICMITNYALIAKKVTCMHDIYNSFSTMSCECSTLCACFFGFNNMHNYYANLILILNHFHMIMSACSYYWMSYSYFDIAWEACNIMHASVEVVNTIDLLQQMYQDSVSSRHPL